MTDLFPREIRTDRLRFVPLDHDSVDGIDLYEIHRSPTMAETMRNLSQDPRETLRETWDALDHAETAWDDGNHAEYAVFPRDGEDGAGEFAGVAGLMPQWDRRVVYFGLWLRKPFWGRGYSGERAAAMMRVCFDTLDADLVSAGYVPGNEQSKRAIEKYVDRFGGQYDGHFRNWIPGDDGARDLHTYSVGREQWADAVASMGEPPVVEVNDGTRSSTTTSAITTEATR